MTYKFIQLDNLAIAPLGAVAIGGLVPLGVVTDSYNCHRNEPTFTVSTSGANTITLNNEKCCGTYRVTYNASVVATAAGLVTLNLVQNGVVIATASGTATAAGDTVNLSFANVIVRNNPTWINGRTYGTSTLQITNTGATALTSGTSHLLVEQVC